MTTTLKLYEVQFSHLNKNGWRPNARKFVFTTSVVRAAELATAGVYDPIVHQVVLRSGDESVILDPEAVKEVTPAVAVGISPE